MDEKGHFRDPWFYRPQEVEDHLPWQLQKEYLLPFAGPQDHDSHLIAEHQEEDNQFVEDPDADSLDTYSQLDEDPLDKMYAIQTTRTVISIH